MILIWLIIILLAGGLLAWIAGRYSSLACRIISLIAVSAGFLISLILWINYNPSLDSSHSQWIQEIRIDWIPAFGISFHLAMDGLSLILTALTMFLGIISVLASWKEITHKTDFFHFNLLWVLAGITGVFLAMDLFLFYFFWEVMLIPMYFIIAIWGHENRKRAAYKFFIYTQAGGLLMFVSILALYFINASYSGVYSFNYAELSGLMFSTTTGKWIMGGFLIAFLVKLPAIPLHNWLPDAHTQAPTAGSVILAGLLLKTGAYGLLRFILPLFPDEASWISPAAMILGVAGILYGAKMAFAQTDLKRMVAYTSISHMGFILLGVFSFTEMALKGVVMQMVTHGISTGALFMIAGSLQDRLHTRDIRKMGGFLSKAPRMSGIALIFILASLGLPGLGNFIAEFLILMGAFSTHPVITIVGALGLIFSAVYALYLMQKVFHGPGAEKVILKDFNVREMLMGISMVVIIFWLGLFPGPVLDTAGSAITDIKPTSETEITGGNNQHQNDTYTKEKLKNYFTDDK